MNRLKFETIKDKQTIMIIVLTIALASVSIVSLLNYKSIETIRANDKTVIVPLNQSSPFWIKEKEVDNQYLTSMARYIADLYQSITPANVLERYNRILTLASSENYNDIKLLLYQKALKIKRYKRNSWSLDLSKASINVKTKQMIVKGRLTRYSKTGIKPTKSITVIIHYQITYAKFEITKLEELIE